MSERRKQIFAYYDGARDRHGDPLAIYRRLVRACDGDPERLQEDAESEIPQVASEAEERLMQAVRVAFEMAPFDPVAPDPANAGATDEDCYAALRAYADYLEKKSQTDAYSPTFLPSSAPPPPAPTSDAASTMATPLPSG